MCRHVIGDDGVTVMLCQREAVALRKANEKDKGMRRYLALYFSLVFIYFFGAAMNGTGTGMDTTEQAQVNEAFPARTAANFEPAFVGARVSGNGRLYNAGG